MNLTKLKITINKYTRRFRAYRKQRLFRKTFDKGVFPDITEVYRAAMYRPRGVSLKLYLKDIVKLTRMGYSVDDSIKSFDK